MTIKEQYNQALKQLAHYEPTGVKKLIDPWRKEVERLELLMEDEEDDFCPECGIGLNNSEKRLKFCQNCKAHWH